MLHKLDTVSPGPILVPIAMEVKQSELAARSRDIEAIVDKLKQDTHRSLMILS